MIRYLNNMNLKIENGKQTIFFFVALSFVVIMIASILFYNFSNKTPNVNNPNTDVEQISSTSSLSNIGEQVPEKVTDFLAALPFISDKFNVFYEDNKIKVYSNVLSGEELKTSFYTWVARFPNFAISKYTVEFVDADKMMELKLKAWNSSNSQLTK